MSLILGACQPTYHQEVPKHLFASEMKRTSTNFTKSVINIFVRVLMINDEILLLCRNSIIANHHLKTISISLLT